MSYGVKNRRNKHSNFLGFDEFILSKVEVPPPPKTNHSHILQNYRTVLGRVGWDGDTVKISTHVNKQKNDTVLVGVLRNRRDRDILFGQRWYRMPLVWAPRRKFQYLAFYQPAAFGREGKRIEYYGRVVRCSKAKRIKLLPDEPAHPRAGWDYVTVYVGDVRKLDRPVRNVVPRRISFGFTTLERLLKSRDILELYGVVHAERLVAVGLRRAGIRAVPQYRLKGKRRYCLDFAVFCKKGDVAIECDNKKAHAGSLQRKKDRAKDAYLKKNGWTVIRLPEDDVISDLEGCISRVRNAVWKLSARRRA